MNAINLKDVWLKYRIEFKEESRSRWEDFWALRGVSLELEKGTTLAIIGENGSGKTSLLKMISGMLKPDKGSLEVNGSVSALMDIGSGFQKELTGRENIYAISALFGFSRAQINARFDEIVKFASLGRFINAPVKVYSQGMYMRLAFAIAIHVDPEILLVDDIFSVGDSYAQRKCIDKMFALKEAGKTIIFVTHELDTAKRFCEKAILLKDGQVIKNGPLKQVVSYYLKTVGDKSGIGILQGERAGAVFNNGKLLVTWQEDALTKESAGHLLVLKSGNWYSSLKADWQVKQDTAGSFTAEAKFWELPFKQTWELALGPEKDTLDIKIGTDSPEEFEIEEISACFLFGDNYKRWFNPKRQDSFSPDDLTGKPCWSCTDSRYPDAGFIGLIPGEQDPAPAIVMEDELYVPGKTLEVHNTDRVLMARALQSRIVATLARPLKIPKGKQALFHLKLRLVKDPGLLAPYLDGGALVNKASLPKVIGDGHGLKMLVAAENVIDIVLQGEKVSSSQGFKANFWRGGRLYQSSDAHWYIHRKAENKLTITLVWPSLPLRELWDFEFTAQGTLAWKVYLEAQEPLWIANNESRVMFSDLYREWITPEAEGEITEEVRTEDFKNIIMKNDPGNIIGLKKTGELPSITICDSCGRRKFSYLDKRPDSNSAVPGGVNVSQLTTQACFLENPKGKQTLDKGIHLVSDMNLCFGDQDSQARYLRKNSGKPAAEKMENGSCRLDFENGRGRIFFGGKELTRGFGLYTSVYSRDFYENGQWYASLDALWEVLNRKKNRLLVKGTWPYLSMVQFWEITLEERRIKWKVDMDLLDNTGLERQQSFLMLSEAYSNWEASSGGRGEFPDEFSLSSWDLLFREESANRVSAWTRGKDLPGVNFASQSSRGLLASVENSSLTFKGRILGFEKLNTPDNCRFSPGRQRYFEGEISFDATR